MRPGVWFHLSGGYELQQRSKESYQRLWQLQQDASVHEAIERVWFGSSCEL